MNLLRTYPAFILFFLINFLYSQNSQVKGKIYYYNGEVLTFNNIYWNRGYFGNAPETTPNWQNKKGIHIYYKKTSRFVPYTKLKSIEIIDASKANCGWQGTIKVKTVTGIEVESPFLCWYGLQVGIFDELTGEATKQVIRISEGNRIIVKKIIFYN